MKIQGGVTSVFSENIVASFILRYLFCQSGIDTVLFFHETDDSSEYPKQMFS